MVPKYVPQPGTHCKLGLSLKPQLSRISYVPHGPLLDICCLRRLEAFSYTTIIGSGLENTLEQIFV
jgi:hypothetical protein